MTKTLSGKFKKWDLSINYWTKGNDPKKYTNQEMVDSGVSITYKFFPSDVEVSVDESLPALTAKMNTGQSEKTILWTVSPGDQGKCLLTQSPLQKEMLVNGTLVIELAADTDGSKTAKGAFRGSSEGSEIRGFGEAVLER